VLVGAKADRIVVSGNKVEGADVAAVDNKAAASAVSTAAPAKPLAVGPDNAPPYAAVHLGGR